MTDTALNDKPRPFGDNPIFNDGISIELPDGEKICLACKVHLPLELPSKEDDGFNFKKVNCFERVVLENEGEKPVKVKTMLETALDSEDSSSDDCSSDSVDDKVELGYLPHEAHRLPRLNPVTGELTDEIDEDNSDEDEAIGRVDSAQLPDAKLRR